MYLVLQGLSSLAVGAVDAKLAGGSGEPCPVGGRLVSKTKKMIPPRFSAQKLAAKIQYAHIKNKFDLFNTDQKSMRKSEKV